jgi:hypothetical protein
VWLYVLDDRYDSNPDGAHKEVLGTIHDDN